MATTTNISLNSSLLPFCYRCDCKVASHGLYVEDREGASRFVHSRCASQRERTEAARPLPQRR